MRIVVEALAAHAATDEDVSAALEDISEVAQAFSALWCSIHWSFSPLAFLATGCSHLAPRLRCRQVKWTTMSFDGTAKDGADYITCNVLFCRRSTGEKRTLRPRGAILTDGKSVAQETAALKGDCVPGGGRPWRRASLAAGVWGSLSDDEREDAVHIPTRTRTNTTPYGTEASAATHPVRKVNAGWFLVWYEDNGVEE